MNREYSEAAAGRYSESEDHISLAELYHENSKQRRHDAGFGLRIMAMNNSPAMQLLFAGSYKTYAGAPTIDLPAPEKCNRHSLQETVESRRSVDRFGSNPLGISELSYILALGNGITASTGHGRQRPLRAAPSAGALYPIEIYVAVSRVQGIAPGIYHYDVRGHRLEQMADQDLAPELGRASSYDHLFTTSSATVMLTGMLGRTQIKYQERAYRFMLLEAGHTAENILLAAASLDLAATPVGGFIDDEVAVLLDIDGVDEVVLELIPVGAVPQDTDAVQPPAIEKQMLAMLWPD